MLKAALIAALLLAPGLALAKEGEASKRGNTATYVELQTLSATCIRPDHSRGVVTVDNGIDVPDPALRAYATSAQPRLQAAYNQFLTTYMSGITPGAPPNADYLVSQLQRLTDQVLGKPGARFLVGSILMN